ncbi:MAG: hypothetical protein VX265_14480 [Myxococcota bacterium]|nr:hypothetical protein [Myxococcota bacterium]
MSDLPASQHAVIDVGYLSGLVDPIRPPDGEALDASEWRRALHYAGVLPVLKELGGDGSADGSLETDLRRVARALARLDHVEAKGRTLEGWVPRGGSVPPWLLLGVALGGIALTVFQHPMLGAVALGAVAVLALLSRAGASESGGVSAGERSARQALVRAVGTLMAHSRVEPVGPGRVVVEVAPHAGMLRQRMHDLDDVMQRARARARELTTLIAHIRGANHALGREPDDAETARLGARLELVRTERERVVVLRERFGESLEHVEAHLEHLRLLALRGALSARVEAVADGGDATGRVVAAAELDAMNLERRAAALAEEVDDARLALAAALETAVLTGSR